MRAALIATVWITLSLPGQAQVLLLFDGSTGQEFYGCLNCGRNDDASVCNRYGTYGSRYAESSIWNPYGTVGSKYENDSPWNRYGEGLRIVDEAGAYYGRLTTGSFNDASRHPLARAIIEAYESVDDISVVRDLLCE